MITLLITEGIQEEPQKLQTILDELGSSEYILNHNSSGSLQKLDDALNNLFPLDLVIIKVYSDTQVYIDKCKNYLSRTRKANFPIIFILDDDNVRKYAESIVDGGMDFVSLPVKKEELKARIFISLNLKKETEENLEYERKQKESEKRFKQFYEAAFKATSEGITIHKNGILLDANLNFSSMFGYNMSEVIGSHLFRYVDENSFTTIRDHLDQKQNDFVEVICRRKDGSTFLAEISGKEIPFVEGGMGKVTAFRDISERRKAEEELRKSHEALHKSEERYSLAVQGASYGIWDWNLLEDNIYFSQRWKEMLGMEADRQFHTPEQWMSIVHIQDREKMQREIEGHLNAQSSQFEIEHRVRHTAGEYRWMFTRGLALRDSSGKPYRMAGSMTDINDRKKAEAQLLYEAFHDSLTNLPNRSLFIDRVRHAMDIYARDPLDQFAIMFIDLDNFKIINDSLGHLVGDELLVTIANRLRKEVRKGDTVARLGGDEFAVLMENIHSRREVYKVAKRIIQSVREQMLLSGREIFITTSLGITFSNTEYQTADEMLRDSDAAMYSAKNLGKNRSVVFSRSMRNYAENSLKVSTEIRNALKNNQFINYYQPVITLSKGIATKLEALVRWNHPKNGIISPADFISIAEETNQIHDIGLTVLDNAAKALKKWHANGFDYLKVSFNISGIQFQDAKLGLDLSRCIQHNGLSPKNFIIELTESVAMSGVEGTLRTLNYLTDLGFEIAIDDFGTGYSSLSYLKRFPIKHLKIDRSFVRDLPYEEEDTEISRAILSLGRNLKMSTVAEGVETKEQLEFLKNEKCNDVQGFLLSRPVPEKDVQTLLEKKWDIQKLIG